MNDCYFVYYIFNFNSQAQNFQMVFDKSFIKEIDEILENLPEYEPSEKVINQILKII